MASILPFKKNLTDLIRGIRNNKNNEQAFISQCIQEIKQELRADNKKDKVNAVQKLSYLQMRGYEMTWAAFNIIEILSLPRFISKRIGYQAAAICFSEATEVVMLSTNLLRKDILSKNQYEAGLALTSLASFCTPDLARDLAPDLVTMLTNSRPYLRKKAVLVLYRVFLKFPDALRPAFNRLKEKLEDADPSVMSAAVNVVCELARKNPKNYIPLAPTLFKILTTSQNNWMLIKIIKLFSALCPHEPRLAKKLVEPLTTIISNSQAMSLLYEAIQACIVGLSQFEEVIKLCLTKLRNFVDHPDQNLKYLGLLAMQGIMTLYPKAVAEHRDLILGCLDDEDVTVRVRALDLITGMVSKKNLPAITGKLMEHLQTAEGAYREDLMEKIIFICSQQFYKFITDFEWYLGVLIDLTKVQSKHGKTIRDQLIDVCVRVQVVRPSAVEMMINFIRDNRLLVDAPEAGGMCEALYAAAWIVGEYGDAQDDLVGATEALLQPKVSALPHHIQSIYVQTLLKIFARLAAAKIPNPEIPDSGSDKTKSRFQKALSIIDQSITIFSQSTHLEVQERSCFLVALLNIYKESATDLGAEVMSLFDEPLNPVKPGAADQVPIPEGLDLDKWINEPPPEPEPLLPPPSAATAIFEGFGPGTYSAGGNNWGSQSITQGGYVPGTYQPPTQEEIERRKLEHRNKMSGNIHYLGGESQAPVGSGTPPPSLSASEIGLPSNFSLNNSGGSADSHHREHRSRHGHSSRSKRSKDYIVNVAEDVPEGFQAQKADQKKADDKADPLGKIDLRDIAPSEQLQHARHRTAASDHSHVTSSPKSPTPAQPNANYLGSPKSSGSPAPSQEAAAPASQPAGGDKHREHRSSNDKDSHRSSHRSSHSSSHDKDKDRGRSHRSHHSSSSSKSLRHTIVKTTIDPAAFINLLKTQLPAMQTGSINVPVSKAVQVLGRSFGMTVVDEKPDRASTYGRMPNGAQLAILLKEEGGKDQLAVAVKAPDAPLAEGILKELVDYFKAK